MKELEKLKTSPIIQLETKFGNSFSVVEEKTLRVIKVTIHIMSMLIKNDAEKVQESKRHHSHDGRSTSN